MNFIKKNIKNIVFFVIILLILLPQTRTPIQVALQRAIAFVKPVQINENKNSKIDDYNWELIDTKNTIYNFKSAQGKVVLINFWATWCPPCIAEMPSMQALYNDYKDKVVFLFITNDEIRVINSFLNKNKYTFPVYRPVTDYPKFFNITTIPRTFLIDTDGAIIIDENGVANWNSKKIRATMDGLVAKR